MSDRDVVTEMKYEKSQGFFSKMLFWHLARKTYGRPQQRKKKIWKGEI
jgi:hypothetical protein